MSTKTRAEMLADVLEAMRGPHLGDGFREINPYEAAAEIRRLAASEAALLGALEYIVDAWIDGMGSEWNQSNSASKARALIARTKEARNG